MSQQDVRWRFYKSPSSSHATQYAELRFVPKRPATERQFSRPSSRSSSCSGSVTSLGSGLSASESRDFSRHHSLHLERLSRIRSSSRRSLARPRRLHDAKGRMATNLRYKQIQKQNSINKTKLAALKNERRRRPVVVALKKTRRSRRQTPTRPPWQSPMGRDDHGIILPPISRKGRRVMAAEHAARLGSSRWGRAPMTERNVRKAASTYRHAHPLFEAKKRAVAPSRPAWQWPAHLEHLAPAVAKVLSVSESSTVYTK